MSSMSQRYSKEELKGLSMPKLMELHTKMDNKIQKNVKNKKHTNKELLDYIKNIEVILAKNKIYPKRQIRRKQPLSSRRNRSSRRSTTGFNALLKTGINNLTRRLRRTSVHEVEPRRSVAV